MSETMIGLEVAPVAPSLRLDATRSGSIESSHSFVPVAMRDCRDMIKIPFRGSRRRQRRIYCRQRVARAPRWPGGSMLRMERIDRKGVHATYLVANLPSHAIRRTYLWRHFGPGSLDSRAALIRLSRGVLPDRARGIG